jgi:peptidyl-prolyl cis-trans isomerase SurA
MRALLLITACLIAAWPLHAEVKLLDSIAAVVDNDVVMTSELEERTEAIYRRIRESGNDAPSREALKEQVLERLILERIQLNMADRAGVRIGDDELNQALANIAERQGMTLDQFIAQVGQEGLSLHQIKEQIRNEMLISRVQQAQVNRRIRVSEQEVDNFLESEEGRTITSPEVHLGHILLPLSSGASKERVAEVRARADDLIAQLQAGANFDNLAITHSAGQQALQGGDLGWRKTNQLPDVFIEPVRALEPDAISAPIRSDAGFHILKLHERRGSGEQIIQQSKVRHILLKPNEIRDDEETRRQLADIAERIRQGADFGELAKEYSEDIGSALNGGDVGWSLPGKFVPRFEEVIDNTDKGEVSDPFRTQFGWHIIEVTDQRRQDFSEDIKRNQARNILRERKFEEELQIWLQEIRDEAYVETKI